MLMRSAVSLGLRRGLLPVAGLALLAAASCYQRVALPPINPVATGAHQPGKFIWRDLLTDDVPRAQRFYGALFGWAFETVAGGKYVVIRRDGTPIGGIVASTKTRVKVDQWVSWLSVADVDSAVRIVREAGGNVIRGPLDLEGRGRLAVVTDPQGALLVIGRTADGDPRDEETPVDGWLWTELWTHDKPSSMAFYQRLAGYQIEERDLAGVPYSVLTGGGAPRAGVVKMPFDSVPTNWLPYVRVTDVPATIARARELGGRVLVEPADSRRRGTAAIVADPMGAAFVIQRWPVE
jgi:predicted enzyme related to lactoylglutathione lyase